MTEQTSDSLLRELEGLRTRVAELEAWNHAVEQAGEALRRSDESFRRIFDHSNDGIFVLDFLHDRVVDANRRACQMLGYELAELLATPLSAIHRDEIEELKGFATAVQDNGAGLTREFTWFTKNGARIPAEMSASIMNLSSRAYMVAMVRDISDRKRAEEELRRANRRMSADLEAAARIQNALLPRHSLVIEGLRSAWQVRQSERLGGDTLNVFALDRDHVGIFLVDVSGHGVTAAMHSLAIHRVLSPFPANASLLVTPNGGAGVEIEAPAQVATQLNAMFPMDPETRQYFTLLYGVLNTRTRELRFVSAGQGAPVYVPPGGRAREIAAYDFPIGIVPDFAYQEHRLPMEPGSRLYVYSDGITDTFNADDEPFGIERTIATIEALRSTCLPDAVRELVERSIGWGCEVCLKDDMSVLAIEIV